MSGRRPVGARPVPLDAVLSHCESLPRTSLGSSLRTTALKPPGTGREVASTLAAPGNVADHWAHSSARTTVASVVPRVSALSPACGYFSWRTLLRSLNDRPASFSMPRPM
jgi:hypothetical protein